MRSVINTKVLAIILSLFTLFQAPFALANDSALYEWDDPFGTENLENEEFFDLDALDAELDADLNSDLNESVDSDSSEFNLDGDLRVELVRGDDGRDNIQQIMLGDLVVDRLPPNTLCPTHEPKFVEKMVVLYGDQSSRTWRANGFATDIPFSGHIDEVVKGEDGKALIHWTKADGSKWVLEIVTIQERGAEFPAYTAEPLVSKSIDGQENNSGTDEDMTSVLDGMENPFNGTYTAPTNDGSAATPAIELPGNSYGVDPVLSDSEIEMVARMEIDKIRSSFQGPAGTRLNEWGVQVGNGITHSGSIDGYRSPIHFWVATNATVRSAVQEAAQNVRRQVSTN